MDKSFMMCFNILILLSYVKRNILIGYVNILSNAVDVTPTGFSDGRLTAFYRDGTPTGLKRGAVKSGVAHCHTGCSDGAHRVLQRWHPYGVEERRSKIGSSPLSYKNIGYLGVEEKPQNRE